MIEPIQKLNMIFGLMFMALMGASHHAQASGDEQEWPFADWATPSRDGSKLAFVVSEPTKRSTIWISDRDGSNPRILIDWRDSVQTEPDWAPDGQSIVFASDRGSRGFNIWTVRVDGTYPTQLTADVATNHQPRYSPNGGNILFTSNRTGKRELWYMVQDGSGQKAIGLQSTLVGDPSWSPDGKSIAYVGCALPPGQVSLKGVCNLFIISLDGSTVRQVTSGNFEDWNPDWGVSDVVFTSLGRNGIGLWLVNPNGNNLRRITSNSLDLNPKWDHSSNSVVFTRGNEIWSTDLHGNETQLTHFSLANRVPIANAGPDQIVRLGSVVILDGSASRDPDDGPSALKYFWRLMGDIQLPITDITTVHPKVTASATGTFTFVMWVNDGRYDSLETKVNITVPKLGDIDGDGNVNNNDLAEITSFLNKPASNANDLRDINSDLKIDALDARKLVLLCNKPRCAP